MNKIAAAFENKKAHGENRQIDADNVLDHQCRIIIYAAAFKQKQKEQVRDNGIKTADQQKADFLRQMKPEFPGL